MQVPRYRFLPEFFSGWEDLSFCKFSVGMPVFSIGMPTFLIIFLEEDKAFQEEVML